jgi:hypothetical protein
MRRAALLSVLLLGTQGFAQTAQVALDLGPVTVWLGMPKQEALEKLSNAGYKIGDPGPKDVPSSLLDGKLLPVINKTPFPIEESWRNVYSISFTGGRLSYAERSWFDEKDPLASVIDAIGALTGRSSRSCSLTYSPTSSPGMSATRVFIDCGKRSLSLVRGEYESDGSKHPWFGVHEYIGNSPE